MNTIRRIFFLVLAVVMYVMSTRAYAQCMDPGCTWIDVSPTGQTLICTMLQSGQAYCEVQR